MNEITQNIDVADPRPVQPVEKKPEEQKEVIHVQTDEEVGAKDEVTIH